jgi:hypothetical protein
MTGGALGFLATSGGIVALGTLFGLAGGGLTSYRVGRRMKGIQVNQNYHSALGRSLTTSNLFQEFKFEKIVKDPELPQIPSLHVSGPVIYHPRLRCTMLRDVPSLSRLQ